MTAISPFTHLKVDRSLACEFLGVFARCEYALKACGLMLPKSADPDWDHFGKTIDAEFIPAQNTELNAAVTYLLQQPPKKQVRTNSGIGWKNAPPDDKIARAVKVLRMVRRVRNNPFHGGKFVEPEDHAGDRDRLLIEHSLTVLRTCIHLHACGAAAYDG